MGKAGRVHGLRSALVMAGLVAVVFGGVTIRNTVERGRQELLAEQREEQRKVQAAEIVQGLLNADTSQVKTIIGNLSDHREYATDDLKEAFEESPDDTNAKPLLKHSPDPRVRSLHHPLAESAGRRCSDDHRSLRTGNRCHDQASVAAVSG